MNDHKTQATKYAEITDEYGLVAITHALLNIADSIDRLNLRTSTEHQHIHTLGNPACLTCGAIDQEEPAEPTTDAEWAEQIERLAADLWKADPSNNTPARTYHEDYGTTQDRYRTLARAALGIHDEPQKDTRKP